VLQRALESVADCKRARVLLEKEDVAADDDLGEPLLVDIRNGRGRRREHRPGVADAAEIARHFAQQNLSTSVVDDESTRFVDGHDFDLAVMVQIAGRELRARVDDPIRAATRDRGRILPFVPGRRATRRKVVGALVGPAAVDRTQHAVGVDLRVAIRDEHDLGKVRFVDAPVGVVVVEIEHEWCDDHLRRAGKRTSRGLRLSERPTPHELRLRCGLCEGHGVERAGRRFSGPLADARLTDHELRTVPVVAAGTTRIGGTGLLTATAAGVTLDHEVFTAAVATAGQHAIAVAAPRIGFAGIGDTCPRRRVAVVRARTRVISSTGGPHTVPVFTDLAGPTAHIGARTGVDIAVTAVVDHVLGVTQLTVGDVWFNLIPLILVREVADVSVGLLDVVRIGRVSLESVPWFHIDATRVLVCGIHHVDFALARAVVATRSDAREDQAEDEQNRCRSLTRLQSAGQLSTGHAHHSLPSLNLSLCCRNTATIASGETPTARSAWSSRSSPRTTDASITTTGR